MKRLLERAGRRARGGAALAAPDVDSVRGRSRRRVINEALRPAEATGDWVQVIEAVRERGPERGRRSHRRGAGGPVGRSPRATEEEAASVGALLLREALETPGKTAALVTPDPALARRVSARLARWGGRRRTPRRGSR